MIHDYGAIYINVYNDLLKKCYIGEYKYGDKLPTVDRLCEIYGTGINAIRRAIKKMRGEGLICTESRNGTTVIFDFSKPEHLAKVHLYQTTSDESTFNTLQIPSMFMSSMCSAGILNASIDEKIDLILDITVLLRNIQQGVPFEDRVRRFFSKVVFLTRNPLLKEICDDIMCRFVLFVPPQNIHKQAELQYREVNRLFFINLKYLIEVEDYGGIKRAIKVFYKELYQIPNVFLFSSTHKGIMEIHYKTLYRKIAQKLSFDIFFGNLQKGDILPTQDKMCEMYQVGRNTILKACETLKRMKLIESFHRCGTVVIASKEDESFQKLQEQQLNIVSREAEYALMALWLLTREICNETTKYASDEVFHQMQSNLDEQWQNAKDHSLSMLIVNALVTPMVVSLNNHCLCQYYFYILSLLSQFVEIHWQRISNACCIDEQMYVISCEAIQNLRQNDITGFMDKLKMACLQNNQLFIIVDNEIVSRIDKWDVHSE